MLTSKSFFEKNAQSFIPKKSPKLAQEGASLVASVGLSSVSVADTAAAGGCGVGSGATGPGNGLARSVSRGIWAFFEGFLVVGFFGWGWELHSKKL